MPLPYDNGALIVSSSLTAPALPLLLLYFILFSLFQDDRSESRFGEELPPRI